jgi:colanic acid biosynthesis glycosyl transferase WcaI
VSRVLLCSSYFWPDHTGIALYSDGFATHLAARGDEVTVVTGFPHYPSWRRPPGRRRLAARERHGPVRVSRRAHYVPARQSALRRGAYEASFLTGLTALDAGGRPDVVVGVSPCLASAAVALAAGRRHGAPVALIFQDVVGLAAAQSGIEGGARLAALVGRLELGFARRATRVGLTAAGFSTFFREGGVAPERVVVLRNWVERTAPEGGRAEARRALGWAEDELVCLHAGNMGRKQGLQTLVDAAARLAPAGVRVVLCGDGHERAALECRATSRGARVSWLNFQPPGAYEAMLEAADVLAVCQRASVTDMALPSKLTAYFAAARPVVAAVAEESETAAEVRRARAGVVVTPEDPRALADAVLGLGRDPAERGRLGEQGRRYAIEHLQRPAVLARWAELVDQTRAAGRR